MDGVSISRIKTFKACRRAYYLKYVEGVVPAQTSDALETGLRYHDMLDVLYKQGEFEPADYSKEAAMVEAYKKYIYPFFKVGQTEVTVSGSIGNHTLTGRLDGIAEDGRIVEHKTTSADITEEYEYSLQWDEQIIAYMYMLNVNEAWYTVCRKPTIRQKKDESDEEFFRRMVEWYDEDTEHKIRYFLITRTKEEIDRFAEELKETIDEAEQTGVFYRNTANCNKWGRRCEYASICLEYDPEQEYVEFIRREANDNLKS